MVQWQTNKQRKLRGKGLKRLLLTQRTNKVLKGSTTLENWALGDLCHIFQWAPGTGIGDYDDESSATGPGL